MSVEISSTDSDRARFCAIYPVIAFLSVSTTEEALERTSSATHNHPFCEHTYLFFHVCAICFPAHTNGENKDAEPNRYDGAWSRQHQIFRRVTSGLRSKKSACDLDLHEMPVYRLCRLVNSRKPGTWVSARCSNS